MKHACTFGIFLSNKHVLLKYVTNIGLINVNFILIMYRLQLGSMYVGVPEEKKVTLRNNCLLPCKYVWVWLQQQQPLEQQPLEQVEQQQQPLEQQQPMEQQSSEQQPSEQQPSERQPLEQQQRHRHPGQQGPAQQAELRLKVAEQQVASDKLDSSKGMQEECTAAGNGSGKATAFEGVEVVQPLSGQQQQQQQPEAQEVALRRGDQEGQQMEGRSVTQHEERELAGGQQSGAIGLKIHPREGCLMPGEVLIIYFIVFF
jgi:hypothetical protein